MNFAMIPHGICTHLSEAGGQVLCYPIQDKENDEKDPLHVHPLSQGAQHLSPLTLTKECRCPVIQYQTQYFMLPFVKASGANLHGWRTMGSLWPQSK